MRLSGNAGRVVLLLLTAWEAGGNEGKGEHPGLLSTLPSECLRSRLNHTSFTHGIRALLDAPLRELRAPGFVVDAVRQIGLTPSYVMWVDNATGVRTSIYGEEARYRLPPEFSIAHGMWQIPQQFECALGHLRALRPQHVLTVGTWSGWTDAFLNAYLRRFAPAPEAFTYDTFDVQAVVSQCVGRVLGELGANRVVFGREPLLNHWRADRKRIQCKRVRRRRGVLPNVTEPPPAERAGCDLPSWLAHGLPGLRPRAVYDVCFIDGDHAYDASAADYLALRPRCRALLFHDIVNSRVGARNVPRLWAQIKARASPAGARAPAGGWPAGAYAYEVDECVYQPARSDQRMMGIGVVRALSPVPMPEAGAGAAAPGVIRRRR